MTFFHSIGLTRAMSSGLNGKLGAAAIREISRVCPIGWDNVLLYGEYQLNRSLVRSERLSV